MEGQISPNMKGDLIMTKDNMKLWAVHYIDTETNRKGWNVVEAESNELATSKCGIFHYKSRFTWIGTEPYHNVE